MFNIELQVKVDEFEARRRTIQQSLFPVELEVAKALYSFCQVACRNWNAAKWRSDKCWTKSVKEELCSLGKKKGYLVFPKKTANGFSEQWLLDLVWAVAEPDSAEKLDWRKTRRLVLACESEWNSYLDNILYDFYKLTFVLADLRLFIYRNRPTWLTKEDPAELCKAASPLSNGFRYLLMGFPADSEGKFRIDAWTA